MDHPAWEGSWVLGSLVLAGIRAGPLQTHQDWCKAWGKERGENSSLGVGKPHPTGCLEGLGPACFPAALGLWAALGCWGFLEVHLERQWLFQPVTPHVEARPFPCLWLASVPQGHLQAGASLGEDQCCLPCARTQGCTEQAEKQQKGEERSSGR